MKYNVEAIHLFVKCGEQFKAQATPDVLAAGPKI
jgi:hypothetical protein